MIRTTINWSVKNLKGMYDEKNTLSFNHPIQRQAAQWSNEQQSLLIHSMLANFPIPNVYVHKVESIEADAKGKHVFNYSVLDGKQRMTSVFSYINGEYALSEELPEIELEGQIYDIAGKFFDDLDEDVQKEILHFRFCIQAFEDVDDETIEEIFFRLNNSTPLSTAQKTRPSMGVQNSIFVNELLESRFFREKCSFSKGQLKKSDDLCTLLQSMLLLDNKHRAYEYESISQDAVMRYSQFIKNNYPEECRDRIKRIVGFLDNTFYMKERNLKKINIPILILIADVALERGISGSNFRRWFYDFFENHKEEYSQYCSSGSIKKEKTAGRISVMSKYFEEYFAEPDDDTITAPEAEEEIIPKDSSCEESSCDINSDDVEETTITNSIEETEANAIAFEECTELIEA